MIRTALSPIFTGAYLLCALVFSLESLKFFGYLETFELTRNMPQSTTAGFVFSVVACACVVTARYAARLKF